MQSILDTLGTGLDLLLVILGFGLIIVFHELGHFFAARWAGIRVLAFAVGFGSALVSYRKGLGWRRGSSAAEYQKLAEERGLAAPGRLPVVPGISPTEYRLNVLPFGGYVKMLGQDDADPGARSDEPDSYQSKPPWKRMIVISAGVVANFIVAALIFVAVFMVGLKTEPPVVGDVLPGSPASRAVAVNAKQSGGAQPGDKVLSINGDRPDDFSDIVVATAMARKGRSLRFAIERRGYDEPLLFDVRPEIDPSSKLLQIGVAPSVSTRVASSKKERVREQIARIIERAGYPGLEPGMQLVRIGDSTEVASAYDIERAARRSAGQPLELAFRKPEVSAGAEHVITLQPKRELQVQTFWTAPDRSFSASHLLGLMPVMAVDALVEGGAAEEAGLQPGDIFVQLGSVEWPSIPEGVAEIRGNARGAVRVVVLRETDNGPREVVLGDVPVSREGTIGFNVDDSSGLDTLVTAWPAALLQKTEDRSPGAGVSPAASLALMRGSRILRVNDTRVSNFAELTEALIAATRPALDAGAAAGQVTLAVQLPVAGDGEPAIDTVSWSVPREAINELHALGWTSDFPAALFELDQFILKAADPAEAIAMGIRRTHRVMMQTYLTFSRLFQGSVRVEHLKGPVGIAHIGTLVASRGFVHLLFFMALISVNLGVVNFLPIPIADGGHFVFLLYEQITGKPVSVLVQNIATLAGLALIAGMFLLVTYNDIANLFG